MTTAKVSRTNRSRREDRQKFLWLDQVKADREKPRLPRSAFVVAFELMNGFNAQYGGACWKSIETLAKETGLSEPSIVRVTRQLAQHGHLRVEPGKAGRGHSNRYFMVSKTAADGAFNTKKGSAVGGLQPSEKGSVGESKGFAGGGDLPKTHLRDAKASQVSERESEQTLVDAPGAPAPDGARPLKGEVIPPDHLDRFGELLTVWSVRPWGEDDADACLAFTIACREADPNDIVASARRWVAAADDPRFLKPLTKWLAKGLWKKPPPKLRRGRRDEPSLGEMLAAKYGGRS